MRRSVLAFLLAVGVQLVGPAAAEEKKVYRPVPPEREYFRLRNLMANGMMPNYKALWYAFRVNDRTGMEQALSYMGALCRDVDRYPPPGKAGSPEDFKKRMAELDAEAGSLSDALGGSLDRSAVSARILSLYKTCQSCHDIYAPEERKDARKYSPPD
jgi:hypothetical protein